MIQNTSDFEFSVLNDKQNRKRKKKGKNDWVPVLGIGTEHKSDMTL